MEKAIAYIRVSDQRQADDGSSLSTQEKQVLAYAKAKGYEFHKLFREEGESAKTDLRPQLQELLRFCQDKSRGIRVLIVPKIDRLARNAFDYASIKLALQRVGVRIESVGEKIEDSPVGRFTESIMASVAQLDNEVRSERSKGGMIEAVLQGRWVWQAPKGYRNIRFNGKGTIEPDPSAAPLIQKAFVMLGEGHQGPTSLIRWLEASGLKVSRTQFYNLIANPVYVGKIHAFGKVTEAVPPFVPLVTEHIFYKAQAALRKQVRPDHWKRDREEFPLRGTIKCTCGDYMTAHWAKGRSRLYPYYRCMSCTNANLKLATVEDHFVTELGWYQVPPELWQRIQDSILRQSKEDQENRDATQVSSREKITALIELQKAIALKNAAGVIPDDIAKAQIEDMSAQIAQLSADMSGEGSRTIFPTDLEVAEEILLDPTKFWKYGGMESKKDLLRFLYPSGVRYDREKGFQTADYQLLEQIKADFQARVSGVVPLDQEFSNHVLDWVIRLENHCGRATGKE